MKHDLLLLSNSQVHGRGYLEHAMDALREFLDGRRRVLFAPFALRDHDGYTARIAEALAPLGVDVRGLHAEADPLAAVRGAEVLYVGGGNSFRLLKALRERGLMDAVRERVEAGELAYVGSSAGTNMACPTLRTTNDMPIVQPDAFEAFGLLPFQINPHFQDADPGSTHMGETRAQRLAQFLEENDVPVLGMREGAWLRRRGGRLELRGETGALLFLRGEEPRPFAGGDDLSFLLHLPARFDSPSP
ncbi:MAG: dipeptidase PepE [Gemmatimonadota bacterium]